MLLATNDLSLPSRVDPTGCVRFRIVSSASRNDDLATFLDTNVIFNVEIPVENYKKEYLCTNSPESVMLKTIPLQFPYDGMTKDIRPAEWWDQKIVK